VHALKVDGMPSSLARGGALRHTHARAGRAAAHINRDDRRLVEHNRGDAGGEAGVIGMDDTDAPDIREKILQDALRLPRFICHAGHSATSSSNVKRRIRFVAACVADAALKPWRRGKCAPSKSLLLDFPP